MAYVVERPNKDGTITFQVKWREGGTRQGPQQNEKFGERDSAEQFKKLVDAHGQHWPPGWVRGHGFVEPDADPDDVPLAEWAHRYVDRLTGVEPRTRVDYKREIDLHFSAIVHTTRSGLRQQATIMNVTADDITDWVRAEEDGQRDEKDPETWLRRPADPKSIANRHGLLYAIFQAAVEAEPQLRTKNPCAKTKLPRVDNEIEDEMVFLEREEYQRIRIEITDPVARDLADFLVSTGLRWGEATAVQVRDLNLNGETPTLRVQRAWKRQEDHTFRIGPPKTKKARRTIALAPAQTEILRRHVAGRQPEDFVFRTAMGKHWRHANFYNRKWKPAVAEAVKKGLPKKPRIHDLRHTHVSWLIAANIPLPAIQARLGHESITTTVDRYGHLVRQLDTEISAAVEAALAAPEAAPVLRIAG
ncbi:tyrosine-type recombinase/integrase [Streptomyces gamaensis]|uniref:Tyrosine-type recombinase/integrase n=1 Tax=Streptomyces gamaensis TaxID=1763542 RepID=A0ABW0YUW3_9ACTN